MSRPAVTPATHLIALMLATLPVATLHAQCAQPSADTVFVISGDTFSMRIEAWRDFMPAMPPRRTADGGSDLTVWIAFEASNRRPVRLPVTIRRVWARLAGQWSELRVDSMGVRRDWLALQGMARQGPPWPAGSPIDVAVEWRGGDGAARCTQLGTVVRRIS
ncbi:MAG: hypothetical protein ACREMV_05110 [Gemmatimonadales bacterium]